MDVVDVLGDALKIGAFVYPPLAPVAAVEGQAAPLLKDLEAVFNTPEGEKFKAQVEKTFARHGTSSHAITQALGSARGKLVSDRDQVMIDKTSGA